jgi:hypothetical protein
LSRVLEIFINGRTGDGSDGVDAYGCYQRTESVVRLKRFCAAAKGSGGLVQNL